MSILNYLFMVGGFTIFFAVSILIMNLSSEIVLRVIDKVLEILERKRK